MTIVIVGVGNRLRADDGIGSLIAAELTNYCQTARTAQNIIVFDAEITPENYIDKIVRAKPDWVIFIDACNFGGKFGEFKLFEEDEIQEIAYGLLSTHTLPLTLTMELIKKQHDCRISLLAIQPKQITMGEELSREVSSAKAKIIAYLQELVK
ncbi:MAG: hydrogenase 3 maturation endopeptidase HyCI [candidate division WOR-3 bacterium]|nr:hydrogenase 3 maturation endopeptidase HyCI [candidate division WOR-3 bacterium]